MFQVRKSLIIAVLFFSLFIFDSNLSIAKIENANDEVVSKVGNDVITYGTLEKAFQKNMNRNGTSLFQISKDSLYDFLNLYINYRLKVIDAIDRGFDKDSSVIADIAQNRKILAESYYFEKKLMKPWLKKMLNFRKQEYRIAVLVFTMQHKPNDDTTAAYNKAMSCLNLIKNGADFYKVARDSSQDPETAKHGGEINTWVTAGNLQRSLENVMLTLQKGEMYPELIKTRYGYFILKLLDKQPRVFVAASHILISDDPKDSLKADRIANEVLTKLKNGEDFAKLAKKYSDDKHSAENGGRLDGFYSRSTGYEKNNRKLVPEFEKALFALKDGEVTNKVKTVYGIHIIKRDSSRGLNKEIETKDLKSVYKKSYYEKDKKDFLDSLHKLYKFNINNKVLTKLLTFVDTNKTSMGKNWESKIPVDFYSNTLFSFLNETTSIGEFVKLLTIKPDLRGSALNKNGILKAIDKIVSPMILNKATKSLEKEYPEFSALMKEFVDGILLFKVEQIEVWDKLKFDSTSAKIYWDTTKTRYMTKPKYDISEIFVLSDTVANGIYKQLKDGKNFEELATQKTERKGFREKKGHWGNLSVDDSKLAKFAKDNNLKDGQYLAPQKNEGGYSIIKLNKFLPVRIKTFDEAISDFAPVFQELTQKKLTNEWLDKVKTKHKVIIYEKKLNKIVKLLKKNK